MKTPQKLQQHHHINTETKTLEQKPHVTKAGTAPPQKQLNKTQKRETQYQERKEENK